MDSVSCVVNDLLYKNVHRRREAHDRYGYSFGRDMLLREKAWIDGYERAIREYTDRLARAGLLCGYEHRG